MTHTKIQEYRERLRRESAHIPGERDEQWFRRVTQLYLDLLSDMLDADERRAAERRSAVRAVNSHQGCVPVVVSPPDSPVRETVYRKAADAEEAE